MIYLHSLSLSLSLSLSPSLSLSLSLSLPPSFWMYLHSSLSGPVYFSQGVSTTQAQNKYMDLLSECPAFASMFFEAEYPNKDQRFPRDLWLAINSKGLQIYQRGAVAPIQTYSYEK